jgi:hypothetical protein
MALFFSGAQDIDRDASKNNLKKVVCCTLVGINTLNMTVHFSKPTTSLLFSLMFFMLDNQRPTKTLVSSF